MSCPPLPPRRSGLLVSVRSRQELEIVLPLAVSVIDFKEPRDGPLAATAVELWQSAADLPLSAVQTSQGQRFSAALGEWHQAGQRAADVPPCFCYAKAGPAGAARIDQLVAAWGELRHQLPPSVALVAVAYADHGAANCPPPEAIFDAAATAGISTWLLDTYGKQSGNHVGRHLSEQRLLALQATSVAADADWVLAGSLSRPAAAHYRQMGLCPHLFGVRGAVCEKDRSSGVVASKIQDWLDDLGGLAF